MPEPIQLIFGDSGLIVVAIIAIFLNMVLPQEKSEVNNKIEVANSSTQAS